MFGVWTYQRTMLTPALRKRSKLVNRDFASFHAYNALARKPDNPQPIERGRSGRARGVHRRTARALPYPAPGGQVVMRRLCSQTCCNQRPFYFFSTLCLIELRTLWNSE